MIKVGIIGGAGYTAGELIRILLGHPDAEIVFVNSTSNAGNKLSAVHEGLIGETDMVFTDQLPLDTIDVLFFCTAHGDTRKFRAICKSQYVANPGCFATAIQLALLPLARNLMLNDDIYVNAITGSTGAGVKPGATTHFSWRNNNISIYKPFTHQHLPEIIQSIKHLQSSFNSDINFIPYRGDFTRGIFATVIVKNAVDIEELYKIYREYYEADSFVHVVEEQIDLKQVINTNKCLIHLEKHDDKLLVVSCIDNLLKGASGTAVHNMNLLFNLKETTGLILKSSGF